MNLVKSVAAVTFVAIAFGATAASAATHGDCVKLGTKVNQALSANAGSSSLQAAQKEKTLGAYYCDMDSYQKGVDHYNQALNLLGQK